MESGPLRGDQHGQDRDPEGDPGDAAERPLQDRRDRLARSGARPRGGRSARHPQGLRLVRRAHPGPRGRGGLQPAAQPSARADLDRGGGGRQARAVREAGGALRRRGRKADRGARSRRRAGAGGVHGALPSAMAAGAGAGTRGRDRRAARGPGQLRLHERRSGERAQPGRDRRRRAVRHRLLSDRHRALPVRGGAGARGEPDRLRSRLPDRSAGHASCSSSRPGRRCSTARPSSCPTSACRSSAPKAGSRSRSRSMRRPTGRAGSSSTTARSSATPRPGSRPSTWSISTPCRATCSRARSGRARRSPSRSRTRSPTCG